HEDEPRGHGPLRGAPQRRADHHPGHPRKRHRRTRTAPDLSQGWPDRTRRTRDRRAGAYASWRCPLVGRMKVILALALALAGALSVTACSRSDAGEPNSHLEIAPVERRTLEIRAEAAGLVEPIRVVEVKSKASGEILRLGVETG